MNDSLNHGIEAGQFYRLDVERQGRLKTYTVLVTEVGSHFCTVVGLRPGAPLNLEAKEQLPMGHRSVQFSRLSREECRRLARRRQSRGEGRRRAGSCGGGGSGQQNAEMVLAEGRREAGLRAV